LPFDRQAFETGKIVGFLTEQIVVFKAAVWGSGALRARGLPASLRLFLESGIVSGDVNYLRLKLTAIYRALVRVYDATRAERYFLDETFEHRLVRIYKRTADPYGLDRLRIYNSTTGREEFVDGVIVLKRGNRTFGLEHLFNEHRDHFVEAFHLAGSREENIKTIEDIISDVLEDGVRRLDNPEVVERQVTLNGETKWVSVVVNTDHDCGSIITAFPGR